MGRASRRKRIRVEDDTTLPPALRSPARLAFVAAMLQWKEGDAPPPMPAGVTAETLPELLGPLRNPVVRRAVVRWIAKLTPREETQ